MVRVFVAAGDFVREGVPLAVLVLVVVKDAVRE